MKIIFRTYGGRAQNKQTGLGHVYRCLNLADNLKKSAEIYFLVEDFGGAKCIIKKKGFKNIFLLKPDISLNEDIEKISNYIKNTSISVVVIDKPRVSLKYIKAIKTLAKTVLITDLKNTSYPVDLLVNGFIGLTNKRFNNRFNAICLTGPHYQILDPHFSKIKQSLKPKFDVLVTFGALDEKGLAKIFIASLQPFISKLRVKLILGPISKQTKNTIKIAKKFKNNLKIMPHTNKMYQEMKNSKFGFTTGGVTTYEFASMKIPFAIICDDLHQLPTAKEWEDKGLAINLGMVKKDTIKKFQHVLQNILNGKFNKPISKSYVDGLGSKRISSEILKMSSRKG